MQLLLFCRLVAGSLSGCRSAIPTCIFRQSLLFRRGRSDEAALATPGDLVRHWQREFEAHGIPEAQESSEYIVSFVLGAKTFQSLPDRSILCPVTDEQRQRVQLLCTERLRRMPVQYVIGEWDFGDTTLKMRPPVFIPRPETEELVNLVVDEVSMKMKAVRWGHMEACQTTQHADILEGESEDLPLHCHHPVILEVGCGSGAISLSLLQKLPQSRVVAVDKGEGAVNLTKENADRLKLEDRIQVLHHNILSDPLEELLPWAPVDYIVSNPPYVFEEDVSQLAPEILSYEDPEALYGGPDGLMVIKAILTLTPRLLKDSGSVFLEVDPRHPKMVDTWLNTCPELQLYLIAIHEDFCGKSRFLHLRKGKISNPHA